MRAGVVGSVLVVLAAGAAGGALFMRDQAALQKAQQTWDAAVESLGAGDVDGARDGFETAARLSSQVGGLVPNHREEALVVAEESRRWVLLLEFMASIEEDPRSALALVEADGAKALGRGIPADLVVAVGQAQANFLVDAALALERHDEIDRAPLLFQAAMEACKQAGSSREAEAKSGLERAEVRRAMVQAEAALVEGKDAEASQLVGKAEQALAARPEAFPQDTRLELSERAERIRSELADRSALQTFEDELRELARRVPTTQLGRLLPHVLRAEPPTLRGGYAEAEALARRLEAASSLRAKVEQHAREFAGMVLAQSRGSVYVFVDETEVTNADYAEFLASDDSRKPPRVWGRGGALPADGERHPVAGVSPDSAEAFAAWKGKRLPTIDEWRAATVRSGDDFPWGSGWETDRANLKEAGIGATREVGSHPSGKSHCGGLDLIGNVREVVVSGEGYQAVGGSFRVDAPRSGAQSDGVSVTPKTRFSDVGFRCAKELQWDG